jgi:hypothetical protein
MGQGVEVGRGICRLGQKCTHTHASAPSAMPAARICACCTPRRQRLCFLSRLWLSCGQHSVCCCRSFPCFPSFPSTTSPLLFLQGTPLSLNGVMRIMKLMDWGDSKGEYAGTAALPAGSSAVLGRRVLGGRDLS